MPEENSPQDDEDDNLSLPSIPSIQDAKICHETENFDLAATTTTTTTTTTITARETDLSSEQVINNPHAGGDGHIVGMEQENINRGVHQNDVEAQTTGVPDETDGVPDESDGAQSTEVFNEEEAYPLHQHTPP
eukprot:3636992-Ditylum_brightwellii.AAC.1